ncbi:HOP2 [Hepatospora eriocheir]|uniref:HOP2 n=1 Tax=Hepatospora eriocheir TaxID=1081669 RepID=A0A1X0QH73_9MICR|nr:HOP2 [Hepatospora eriocheir]
MSTSKTKKDEDFKELRNNVYTLFYYSNKPYCLNELVLQFKGYKKTIIEKIITDLENKGLITIKLNNKTKIFHLNQSNLKYEKSEEEYKTEYETKLVELKELKSLNSTLNSKVTSFKNMLTNEEMEEKIKYFKEFLLENKNIKEGVNEEIFNKTVNNLKKINQIKLKRKRIFNDIVNGVSEGMNMKKKEFLDEVGIE